MLEDLAAGFLELKRDEVLETVRARLEGGEDVLGILDSARQGMTAVGDRFQAGTFYLAEMMLAAEIFKEVAAVLKPGLDALARGQEKGVFRKDVSARMFAIFLFGAITYHIFTCFLIDGAHDLLDDFDGLAQCLLSAVKGHEEPARDLSGIRDKKERILIAAEGLFAQKTSEQTTIAEIAEAAGVADGTIYDYFKNKEDLLFWIFSRRMEQFMSTFQETLSPQKAESMLKMAVFHFLSWVQNNRAWAKVLITDVMTRPGFFLSRANELKLRHDVKLEDIYRLGMEEKTFSPNLLPGFFMALVFGPVYFICLPWSLLGHKQSLVAGLEEVFPLQMRAMARQAH